MMKEQKLVTIGTGELLDKVRHCRENGYRLAQIGATRTEAFEINYSFDKDYEFINFKIILPSVDTPVPSVSGIYWNAFLYENEIHDLFGIRIEGVVIDYKGKFYHTSVKTPYGEKP